jgi:pimeloyl-ACP methyl ester carboxylesterase
MRFLREKIDYRELHETAICDCFCNLHCGGLLRHDRDGERADCGERVCARDTSVDGIRIHYTTGGSGPAVILLHDFWNDLAADKNHSIPEAYRKAYLAAYSRPGRMRASRAYFVSWPQTAKDFARMSQTRLTMPALSIGGDKSLGEALAKQMKLVTTNVTVVIVKNSGHWILEEQPKQTAEALMEFL